MDGRVFVRGGDGRRKVVGWGVERGREKTTRCGGEKEHGRGTKSEEKKVGRSQRSS